MPSTDNPAPSQTDLLCESCGYILNGLNDTGNCPECGAAVAVSTSATPRRPSVWEQRQSYTTALARFLVTTMQIIFKPRTFYRHLTARDDPAPARKFARIHWILAAGLLGLASWIHWDWYESTIIRAKPVSIIWSIYFLLLLQGATYLMIVLTTSVAAKLTNWEGTYRGYRLSYTVVSRALYFHAAHFLPVGLVAVLTTAGYSTLESRGVFQTTSATTYLYVLCGEVILCAVYLFNTYWIGMRNLMYANF